MFTFAREISWIRSLLSEIQATQAKPTIVYQDNTGSIDWVSDMGQFNKNMHLDIQIHHIRDLVKKTLITIQAVPTSLMLADILTKAFLVQN